MKNISSIIKQHNSTVLPKPTTPNRLCNGRNKDNCPLDGKYLKQWLVYRAEVHYQNTVKVYYGANDGELKLRYNNHTKSFRNIFYEHDTELWKYIWQLKDTDTPFTRCDLCLTEKYIIPRADQKRLLNKPTEFASKCRQRNKFILQNVK